MANKFFLGIFIIIIFALFNPPTVTAEGLIYLLVVIGGMCLNQLISLASLKKINASTHTVIGQSKLFFLIIFGLLFGQVITIYSFVGVSLCFVGALLITMSEIHNSEDTKNTISGILLALVVPVIATLNSYILEYSFNKELFSKEAYSILTIITIMIVFNIIHAINKTKKDVPKMQNKDFYWVQLTGSLSVMVNISKAYAIDTVGTFVTELVASLAPAFIYLIALFLRTEKLCWRRILGIFISLIGLIISVYFYV